MDRFLDYALWLTVRELERQCLPELTPEGAAEHRDLGDDRSIDEIERRRGVDAMANPWTYRAELAGFARGPQPEEEVRQTFCGT